MLLLLLLLLLLCCEAAAAEIRLDHGEAVPSVLLKACAR